MQCFNRCRLILASSLLCVLTGLLDAPDVQAGLIETPYDSLNWQTSEWGPERDGFRLRVRMPSEVEYNEPILAEIELEMKLPTDTTHDLFSRRLLLSNPILSIQVQGSNRTQQFVGIVDSGSTEYLIGGRVDYRTTLLVRFELYGIRATALTSIWEQRISALPSEPYLAQSAKATSIKINEGRYLGKVSLQVEFLGGSGGATRVAAECLSFEVLPRFWVTYPIRIVCPTRFELEGDSDLVADSQACDTTTVRATLGSGLGVLVVSRKGYMQFGASSIKSDSAYVLPPERFHGPGTPDSALFCVVGDYGYTLCEARQSPGHLQSLRSCEGYRILFHRNPRAWKATSH